MSVPGREILHDIFPGQGGAANGPSYPAMDSEIKGVFRLRQFPATLIAVIVPWGVQAAGTDGFVLMQGSVMPGILFQAGIICILGVFS